MAPRKIIIDTDPGVDDMLALLLALSASPKDLEVLLISLTFGNIDVENCLRNTISLFHVLELDRQWRLENNLPNPYPGLERFKPLVAVGADQPLKDQRIVADYFHGIDGLGGVHTTAPHFTPAETWSHIFSPSSTSPSLPHPPNFTPTSTPAHLAILEILASNPPNTITIVAIGPLTNLSLAASSSLPTFLRAKEVIIMGGAIDLEGNVTPVAEFNHHACPFSAAHIYALTSRSTHTLPRGLPAVVADGTLNLTVFPLDITTSHRLSEETWAAVTAPLIKMGSPLAAWADVFLRAAFGKMQEMYVEAGMDGSGHDISLHDPMCIWYLLTGEKGWETVEGRDVRVETGGQWTRGMCVVDRRSLRVEENLVEGAKLGDEGDWLRRELGNRVRQVVRSYEGCREGVGGWLVGRIFGVEVRE